MRQVTSREAQRSSHGRVAVDTGSLPADPQLTLDKNVVKPDVHGNRAQRRAAAKLRGRKEDKS